MSSLFGQNPIPITQSTGPVFTGPQTMGDAISGATTGLWIERILKKSPMLVLAGLTAVVAVAFFWFKGKSRK